MMPAENAMERKIDIEGNDSQSKNKNRGNTSGKNNLRL